MATLLHVARPNETTLYITNSNLTVEEKNAILGPYLNARNLAQNLKIGSIGFGVLGLIGAAFTRETLLSYGAMVGAAAFYGCALLGENYVQERVTTYVVNTLAAKAN